MSAGPRLRDLAIGAVAGLTGGLFGVGGGIVLIPLLTAWAGLSQHRAHGTSLAAIAGTAVAGILAYGLAGSIAWDATLVVGLSSVGTARIGARLAQRLSGPGLRRAFACFLLVVAARLLWEVPEPVAGGALSGAWRWVGFVILGGSIGVLAAFFGVGGGILAVPAFTLLFGMSQQVAQGTSLGVILLAAPAGAREHARLGNVAWPHVAPLALGALAAAPVSSWVALRTPHEALARGFAVFLVATAVHAWWRAGRATRPPVTNPQ
jgi:uncharacterized membrane protein YfcA